KEGVNKDSLKALLLMLAPLAPFTSEELWEKLGGKFSIHQQLWPKFEEKLAAAGSVTVVIQVNGKLRKKAGVSLADSQNKTKMIALAKELTGRKNPLKEIFVPGRLVNLVVDWF
ncbi:leucine--tRNA ligase, partial [Candidatus Beckwithbacteria bacterium CG23_combo_of_CG06-09_8_20_14_all_47_9]